MRSISKQAAYAFENRENFKLNNTQVKIGVNKVQMYLFDYLIAWVEDERFYISAGGWLTATTKERLNALPNVEICQRKGIWYLNGKEWDGLPIEVTI